MSVKKDSDSAVGPEAVAEAGSPRLTVVILIKCAYFPLSSDLISRRCCSTCDVDLRNDSS